MKNISRFVLFPAACLLLAPAAFSQEGSSSQYSSGPTLLGHRPWSVGVNLASTAVDTTDDNVFSFGVFGDVVTAPNFSVGLSLDYWNDDANDTADRRIEMENLIVGANAKFLFPGFAPGFRPYVLAGLAAHRFEVSTTQRNPNADPAAVLSEYDRDLEDVEGEFGADFGAGLGYRIQTAMDVVGEVRYRRVLDRTLDLDQVNYSVALAYML